LKRGCASADEFGVSPETKEDAPMKRIPPSQRTKEELKALLEGKGSAESFEELRGRLVRLATEHVVEAALEAEVSERLGREYYRHRKGEEQPVAHRNGYRYSRLKTGEGEIRFAVPQVAGLETVASKVKESLSGRTDELERLGIELYARGLSTRDIERTFVDEEGRALLSRSAVSALTEKLWEEYQEFTRRDLSDLDVAYLFIDGVAERIHTAGRREAVLCAWAILFDGRKVLVHMAPGSKETTSQVVDFIEGVKGRGLRDPVLVATDGAPGLIRAVEETLPSSLRQRCLAHRMRNLMDKLPEEARPDFREAAQASYQAPSQDDARILRKALVQRFGKTYPSAVACFEDDFEACIAHLRCPVHHRRLIRTTNLLERLFLEERRRLRPAQGIQGEHAVLKLMFAALVRGSERWRQNKVTEFERAQLRQLREQLSKEHDQRHKPLSNNQPQRLTPSNSQQP
jgi:putative transposase